MKGSKGYTPIGQKDGSKGSGLEKAQATNNGHNSVRSGKTSKGNSTQTMKQLGKTPTTRIRLIARHGFTSCSMAWKSTSHERHEQRRERDDRQKTPNGAQLVTETVREEHRMEERLERIYTNRQQKKSKDSGLEKAPATNNGHNSVRC